MNPEEALMDEDYSQPDQPDPTELAAEILRRRLGGQGGGVSTEPVPASDTLEPIAEPDIVQRRRALEETIQKANQPGPQIQTGPDEDEWSVRGELDRIRKERKETVNEKPSVWDIIGSFLLGPSYMSYMDRRQAARDALLGHHEESAASQLRDIRRNAYARKSTKENQDWAEKLRREGWARQELQGLDRAEQAWQMRAMVEAGLRDRLQQQQAGATERATMQQAGATERAGMQTEGALQRTQAAIAGKQPAQTALPRLYNLQKELEARVQKGDLTPEAAAEIYAGEHARLTNSNALLEQMMREAKEKSTGKPVQPPPSMKEQMLPYFEQRRPSGQPGGAVPPTPDEQRALDILKRFGPGK